MNLKSSFVLWLSRRFVLWLSRRFVLWLSRRFVLWLSRRTGIAVIFCLFFVLTLLVETSGAKIIEKILVIVNDDVITKTELDERLAETKDQLRQIYRYNEAKLSEELEKAKPEILDMMIDEILFIQESMKRNIKVSDSEVQAEIENIKKEYSSDQEFQKALEAEGYTMDTLKKKVKRTLLLRGLIEQRFKSELLTTDDEVRKFYRDNRDKFPSKSDSVKLKQILIKFNISQADIEKARLRAENILKQCIDGADFGEMAGKFSDDPSTKIMNGDMGYFVPGTNQYYPELENAASKLALGEISGLIETPTGYDIIKVTDINEEDGSIRAQRISISAWPSPASEKAAEEKADSVLEELKNGADFVEMVKKYSDDPITRAKGGDWGDVPIDKMTPELRGAFDSFSEGEISRPVKTPYGIHIFKVVQRSDLTAEEMEQLREFLYGKKLQEKLHDYSQKLRESAYIQTFTDD